MVTAVVNQKGGVGKTTTVINLAGAFSAAGVGRVLVIDLDAQAHSGKALGAPRGSGPDVADLIWEGRRAEEVIRREPRLPGVDVIAGSRAMASYDLEFADAPDRLEVIGRIIDPLRTGYDHILLDLPPGLGLVHVGCYMAADWVLAPVIPEADAVDGLVDLVDNVDRAARDLGARARLTGVLLTMVDRRTREHRDNAEEIRDELGPLVFDTVIHQATRVREASRERVSVLEHAPACTAARDYVAAAAELVARTARGG